MRFFATLLISFSFILPSVHAEKNEFTLKGATVAPPNTPWSELLKQYKKLVRKGSEKRIKVKVYLGGTKGDEHSIVRQVRKGTLQAAGVSTGAMSVVVPEIDIFELPYLFDSAEQADRVLDAVRPLVAEILEAKGFKLIMYSENGYRCFGSKKPLRTPDDLKAYKMRAQESPSHLAMYAALGASARPISVGEVLPALQTGNVDGFDNTALFTQAASWHQGIQHFTVSNHIYQPALLILNKAFYDSLPPELQAIVIPTNNDLEIRGRKGIRALTPLLLKNFEQQNVTVYTLTDAQLDAFRSATRPAWGERMKNATPMGKKLFAAIQAAKQGK
jgi:tripartite ATP-independent transporter DctP family solute receptor